MVAQIKIVQSVNKPTSVTLPVAPPRSTVQVFTSPQRSFYADVIAQALRIAVQGTPTLVVQFLQGGINQGVEHPRRLGENVEWLRCNLSRKINHTETELTEAERQAVIELWQFTKDAIAQGKYSLFVLDELNLAIEMQLIDEIEVLEAIKSRPLQMDIILTGANMSASLINCADQVTQRRN